MKKPILFLTSNYDPSLTGGTKVDCYIIERLKMDSGLSVEVMDDRSFSKRYRGSFSFNFCYLKEIALFRKADYLIMNSRLYPRLLLLLVALKFLRRKPKVILIHHHFDFMSSDGWEKMLRRGFELGVLKLSQGVILISPYVRDLFASFKIKVPIHYLEIGFEKNPKTSATKRTTNFLFVGTVERRKGVDAIVSAVALLKKKEMIVKVDIIGKYSEKDPYYEALRGEVEKNGLKDQIVFWGRVSDERLEEFFSEAYAFLFPTRLEGYGMVLVEALSYGLPVISFNNSAVPYVIEHDKNGILVETENVIALSEAISCLLLNESLRETFSGRATKSYDKIKTLSDWNRDIDIFCESLK